MNLFTLCVFLLNNPDYGNFTGHSEILSIATERGKFYHIGSSLGTDSISTLLSSRVNIFYFQLR